MDDSFLDFGPESRDFVDAKPILAELRELRQTSLYKSKKIYGLLGRKTEV